ncbi:ORC ubiquitin ligase 1 [Heterodontus francisci]|uniref:ORC ubiquitin ligase 1 n=1 Tax=Heterodontus francisci TaxID=7792 RepID=UPI00355AE4CE
MQKPALQNVQNVTLSLTLPISCQICLGKVRQPVICSNNHVFCFMCMQSWLKNSTQCPTCRVPITSENPFKEVLGGTDGTENYDSPSVKRHLRKTRLELLHKEYEEEIESLQKEIEELRGKNLSLESQLKTVLDPTTKSSSSKVDNPKQSPTGQDSVPDLISQQEWKAKLTAATEIYEKTKADLAKLKEAHQKLRVQNGDLVRENLHLKAEVVSRSPQKFGRFTVAALQSKVEQYEREMKRLKRALERSDKYIEDMEFQIEQLKRKSEEKENESGKLHPELPSVSLLDGENGRRELRNHRDDAKENRIAAMRRSLSNIEQPLVNQLDDAVSTSFSFSCQQSLSGTMSDSVPVSRVPADNGLLTTATVENDALCVFQKTKEKEERHSPPKDESEIQFELPSPCTPSTSLGALHLHSTDDEVSPLMKMRNGGKKLTHLRKLCFDDAGWRNVCSEEQILPKQNVDFNSMPNAEFTSSGLTFWDTCQPLPTESGHKSTLKKNLQTSQSEDPMAELEAKIPSLIGGPVTDVSCFLECSSNVRSRTSSETSMDAAYREKISELDFMLDETENLKNPQCSLISEDLSDLDMSLTSDLVQCAELLNEAEKRLEQKKRQNQLCAPASDTTDKIANNDGLSPVSLPIVPPVALNIKKESLSSEEETPFQSSFSSPFLSVSSDLSGLHHKKPSLWNNCLMPENDKMLKATNRCQTSKRKPQRYGEDLASPSKSSKK